MDADLNSRLDYELITLEQKKKEYSSILEELNVSSGALLRRNKRGGNNYYYYIKRDGSDSFKYIGSISNHEVSRICNARFVEEAIKRIDRNIGLVKSLKYDYLSLDQNHINESLPLVYRCESLPISSTYKDASEKWMAKNLEFQKTFPENYPNNKRYLTSGGVMVKTLSEALIYERFKSAGLTLIYELPFVPKDYGPAMYPDFAVLSPIDMQSVIFVEYVGRMDLQKYREAFAKKVGRYIDSGYIPGVNLFFIYSDRDGNIDSLQISKVIADIVGLRGAELS